jgi:uncharacterized protein
VTASCFYEGTIRHRRVAPAREFRHRIALAYIDLDELPSLLAGRLTSDRFGLLRFRRSDYLGDDRVPLATAVADAVQERGYTRPSGSIRVLTQLRSWGHCFNPVSFYYCLAPDGDGLEAIVTEVTNTPWGDRHSYVLAAEGSPVVGAKFDKALHVSPFMGMDHSYDVRATAPGPTLSVHIESSRAGRREFDATLALARRELTPASARRMSARYPLATVRVLALIYGHALGLKLAGARWHRRPQMESA